MAGRINQVQQVFVTVLGPKTQSHCLGFDRDPPLAFNVHVVEKLILLVTAGERAGGFEQAVGDRALTVIDMSHDAEVSNAFGGDLAHTDSSRRATPAAEFK